MKVEHDKTGTLRACCGGHPPIICLEGNGSRPSHRGGGYSEEGKMFTINTIERHAVCYAIFKLKDNGNPKSGCHETDVCSTLDQNGAAPNCEQGGVLIIQEKNETQNFQVESMGHDLRSSQFSRGGAATH